jgi:hypothetical protein
MREGSLPNEGSQHPPVVSGSVHRELKKVKFPEFMGSTDGLAAEAWLENMAMCFALRDYTSNMKVHGGLSTERECTSLVEDTLTTTEHGH